MLSRDGEPTGAALVDAEDILAARVHHAPHGAAHPVEWAG